MRSTRPCAISQAIHTSNDIMLNVRTLNTSRYSPNNDYEILYVRTRGWSEGLMRREHCDSGDIQSS